MPVIIENFQNCSNFLPSSKVSCCCWLLYPWWLGQSLVYRCLVVVDTEPQRRRLTARQKSSEYYTTEAPSEYYTTKAPSEYYTVPSYYATKGKCYTEVPKRYSAPNYCTAAAPSYYVGPKYYTEVPVTTLQRLLHYNPCCPQLPYRGSAPIPMLPSTTIPRHPSIISLLRQFRPNAPKLGSIPLLRVTTPSRHPWILHHNLRFSSSVQGGS
jgi:hypothetical protein